MLVQCIELIVYLRSPQIVHSKAQLADNGESLSRVATQLWATWGLPFGRATKQPSALLRLLVIGPLLLQSRASHMAIL